MFEEDNYTPLDNLHTKYKKKLFPLFSYLSENVWNESLMKEKNK